MPQKQTSQTIPGLQHLLDTLPQIGRVDWIGLRPAREAPMQVVTNVLAQPGTGLLGDRYAGRSRGKRQVTLIQAEHIPVIASCAHINELTPEMLRRNIVVSGINLLALKNRQFYVGHALLEYTGPCDPCSKMERDLGPGAYNAMRGHGGITARVLEEGEITVGGEVTLAIS